MHVGSRITGWNAVKSRVEQLELTLTDAQIKTVTAQIKSLADVRPQSLEDVDSVLRAYHHAVTTGGEEGATERAAKRLRLNGGSHTNGATNGV